MKNQLRWLYKNNKRCWEVWNHLWLFSDDMNSIAFTYNEICGALSIPHTTFKRMLGNTAWANTDKQRVEILREGNKIKVVFYPNGKPAEREARDTSVEDELFLWLKTDFYPSHQVDYPNIGNTHHKNKVSPILKKIKKVMRVKGTEVTDETVITSFKVYFENMPAWWLEHQPTLPAVNKHFTEILGAIKKVRDDKNSQARAAASAVDFSQVAQKGK